jgi:hypothetical protein
MSANRSTNHRLWGCTSWLRHDKPARLPPDVQQWWSGLQLEAHLQMRIAHRLLWPMAVGLGVQVLPGRPLRAGHVKGLQHLPNGIDVPVATGNHKAGSSRVPAAAEPANCILHVDCMGHDEETRLLDLRLHDPASVRCRGPCIHPACRHISSGLVFCFSRQYSRS